MRLARLEKRLKKLRTRAETTKAKGPGDYADDPVGYATRILRVEVTADQAAILKSLLKAPYRTFVKAGHSLGKTFLAAVAVNWWYDSFNPGVCITTAPTERDVKDLLWAEIRMQRLRVGLPGLQPAEPEMRSGPGHYAKGFTAKEGASFVGRHPEKMLIVFDEAVGIKPIFWEAAATMFRPEPGHAWLAILNPLTSSSWAYIEDQATVFDYVEKKKVPKWTRYTLDCLEHPNIKGKGPLDKKRIEAAVSWLQVDAWVQSWCTPVPPGEQPTALDIEWPMPDCPIWESHNRRFWRQGPSFLARCRGVWPTGGAWAIWNDLIWTESVARGGQLKPSPDLFPEFGVDGASGGEDFTSIHIRWGNESYHHESSNSWKAPELLSRLKILAEEWAWKATQNRPRNAIPVSPKELKIKIDDDGFGRACSQLLQADGYRVVQVSAASKSISGYYPNKRSELWFQVADRAALGYIGLARIAAHYPAVLERLRQQLLIVEYDLNSAGMRVVEPKDITRERFVPHRSPDDADAFNLAYLEGVDFETASFIQDNGPPLMRWGQVPSHGGYGKGLFGGG